MSKEQNAKTAEVTAEETTKVMAATEETTEVSTTVEAPMGFDDDEDANDLIIPRIKIIQSLSPERKEKKADEGDIINSLTLEKLNGKKFIPVFKFNNNILWIDRSLGGGISCMARDAKTGQKQDGTTLLCVACKACEFDNSKQGKDAIPKCTKYINFFGFFEGERMPIILSFGKTNYNEGKKLYSLAKVSMQNMWNHGYKLNNKVMSKAGNEWYIIETAPAGASTEEDRAFALSLFKNFKDNMTAINYDMDDAPVGATSTINTEGSEF